MNLSPTRLSALLIATVGLASQLGCPVGECSTQGECGAGQYCTPDRVCAPLPGGVGDGDGDVVGDGDGDGDGDVTGDGDGDGDTTERTVQTGFPVQWIMRDPRNDDRMLVPLYANGGNVAGAYVFDLQNPPTNTLTTNTLRMEAMMGGGCDLDNIAFLGDTSSGRDETWVVCGYSSASGDLRVVYDEDYDGVLQDEPQAVQFGIPVTTSSNSGSAGNDWERQAWAKRGGALSIFQMRDNGFDGFQQPRATDAVNSNIEGAIQLWQLPAPRSAGADLIIVFDRNSEGARLVPLMRFHGQSAWQDSTFGLGTADLPEGTAAVVLFPDLIDYNGADITDARGFNVVAIIPSTGRAEFLRYGNNQLLYQGETLYEAGAFTSDAPDPTARLLLEVRGDYAWYAHPEQSRAWRIPIDDFTQENRVFRVTLGGNILLIKGIVPVSDTQAWLAVPSQNTLELRTFGPNN